VIPNIILLVQLTPVARAPQAVHQHVKILHHLPKCVEVVTAMDGVVNVVAKVGTTEAMEMVASMYPVAVAQVKVFAAGVMERGANELRKLHIFE
jgi:hypothetical protein